MPPSIHRRDQTSTQWTFWGTRSILNHQQLGTTTPVSLHFNQAGHSINDVRLIPIELIRSKSDSVRKAREAHLINKAKTLHPFGINKRDEARQWHIWHLFNHSLTIIVTYFCLNFYCNGFLFTSFFFTQPLRKVCIANRNIEKFCLK